MNKFVKKIPTTPSFEKNGFNGYNIDIDNKNISIKYEDVYKGHDVYCTNTRSTHIYFVIEGNGKFKINDCIYEVENHDIIEIPPNNKFVFVGKMKLLLIMNPGFDKKDDISGENNDLY